MKRLFILIGIIPALLAATSIQCLAPENIIYGCVSKITEKQHIVGCRAWETPIAWNAVNPQEAPFDVSVLANELKTNGNLAGTGSPELICLGVYDGIERFLGYLAGKVDGYTVEVLDPDTMRFYKVNTSPPVPKVEPVCVVHNLFYTEPDCQGIPYVNPFGDFFGVVRFEPDNTYWIIDPELGTTKKEWDMQSISNPSAPDPDRCFNFATPSQNDIPCFPVRKIEAWWTTTALEYPIEVRPIE